MIGQKNLINQFELLAKNRQLPRFIILVGKKGSGRKILTKLIKIMTGFEMIEVGTKVDDIREMIDRAYKIQVPTIYTVYDADSMSEIAKNSMLKICEEPANSAFIIMTLLDENNTLETIKSRASIYKLENYNNKEILEYYSTLLDKGNEDIICDLCDTPGQVNDLVNLGVSEFMNYVDLVFDNIHIVSGSNAFKIGSRFNLSDEDEKYPLDLFFKAFIRKCLSELYVNPEMYGYGIKVTSKYLSDLRYSSLNKTMLFDLWLLEIREGWLDYAESDS